MKCSSDGCDNYANSENEGNVCNKCFYNWKPFGPNYEYKPTFPLPWEDNRAKKECVEISPIIHKEMASRCGVADEDDLTQYYDSEEILREKAKVMADAIRECKHMVAYSGAGISVSAGIGDFRGPNGCWTLKARGLPTTKSKSVEELKPTFAHRALVELLKVGKLKCVITTNYDALHEKSGIPHDSLCELHGNAYVERCEVCEHEYHREKPIEKISRSRYTGRLCEQVGCGGKLKNSVVAFSESLPTRHLELAKEHSKKADVALVLGSSMRVKPACYLPELCWFHSKLDENVAPGKFFLVNLQKTHYDQHAYVRFFHETDRVMEMVMDLLGIPVP